MKSKGKEKMICTCPNCNTQFFENKIGFNKWKEGYNFIDSGFKYFYKTRDLLFRCNVCKRHRVIRTEEKFIKKEEIINEIKKSWWKK